MLSVIQNLSKKTQTIKAELQEDIQAVFDRDPAARNTLEVLRRAAVNYEPHLLTNYLKDLASLFHGWYNDNRILPKDGETPTQDELDLMQARLRLSKSVRQVIQNGLILLGLTAPTSM